MTVSRLFACTKTAWHQEHFTGIQEPFKSLKVADEGQYPHYKTGIRKYITCRGGWKAWVGPNRHWISNLKKITWNVKCAWVWKKVASQIAQDQKSINWQLNKIVWWFWEIWKFLIRQIRFGKICEMHAFLECRKSKLDEWCFESLEFAFVAEVFFPNPR